MKFSYYTGPWGKAWNSTTLYLCSGRVPAWCSGWVAFSQSVEFVLWIPLLWLGRASNCYAIQVSSAMYWIQPSNIHFQCGLRWSLLCSWIWCTVLCCWGKILPTIFLFLFKKIFFKLADRMRSMRTNGASKNRDYYLKMDHIFLRYLFLEVPWVFDEFFRRIFSTNEFFDEFFRRILTNFLSFNHCEL